MATVFVPSVNVYEAEFFSVVQAVLSADPSTDSVCVRVPQEEGSFRTRRPTVRWAPRSTVSDWGKALLLLLSQ